MSSSFSDVPDDREEFRLRQSELARQMWSDGRVRELDCELTEVSDRHDFSYMWNWFGVPIIQTPSDIVAMQEIIWRTRPQVIVETGVARGGSVIFYSSVLAALGEGKVVAVDIDIRAHNRASIEEHPLGDRVTLIEGSSVADDTHGEVRQHIGDAERVMVVLDSDHTHQHVLDEIRCYAPLVTPGQYLVVADTLIETLPEQKHRPRAWGPGNNPATAVAEFMASGQTDFEVDEAINSKLLITSSRGGYLRRR